MSHELFLTTRETTKKRNNKAQLPKMIQSGRLLRNMLGNVGKKETTNFSISFARDNLPGLVTNLASNAVDKFKRKISRKGAVRVETGFTLFISK